jgi:general transcription factor 3C polypeptide 5 (transcription factor C subunit 1)
MKPNNELLKNSSYILQSLVCFTWQPLAFIQIPKEINWKEFITEGTPMWEWQMVVSKLFEEQPIWPKYSLIERLLDKNLKFTYQTLKRFLPLILIILCWVARGCFIWIFSGK